MSTNSNSWVTCCGELPRSQIVFTVQVTISYIVIIVSLINLSLSSINTCLWTTLASATIGYLLPSPCLQNEQSLLRSSAV